MVSRAVNLKTPTRETHKTLWLRFLVPTAGAVVGLPRLCGLRAMEVWWIPAIAGGRASVFSYSFEFC